MPQMWGLMSYGRHVGGGATPGNTDTTSSCRDEAAPPSGLWWQAWQKGVSAVWELAGVCGGSPGQRLWSTAEL